MSKLIHGDSLQKLKDIPDNSIDLIVTDPPYGYSFMGKEWDKALPDVRIWAECLRVLKAGGFAYIMSAPRQDVLSRMMINLEDSGFKTDFTSMYWTYATGFPKALNVAKAVDKRLGVEVKRLDGSYAGFQPKPAVEVIIVCMKPLGEKGYIEQALANGKGVSWFNDCRIPTGDSDKYDLEQRNISKATGVKEDDSFLDKIHDADAKHGVVDNGRFPANLLVSDCSLDIGNITKSSGGVNTGKIGVNVYGGRFTNDVIGSNAGGLGDSGDYSRYFDLDKWWEAQFIVTPKASKSEKNKGLDDFEEKQTKGGGGTYNAEAGAKFGSIKSLSHNSHPTVKPMKLMSYLITLGSREGDIVLDPFMGSGTTPLACKNLGREYIGIERELEYFKICCARVGDEPINIHVKEEVISEPQPTLKCELCGFKAKDKESFELHLIRPFHLENVK